MQVACLVMGDWLDRIGRVCNEALAEPYRSRGRVPLAALQAHRAPAGYRG